MTVKDKVGIYIYLSKPTKKDVDNYLEKHYHTKMVKSRFFEEAARAYLDNQHTHIDPYINKPRSRLKQIIDGLISVDLYNEVPLEQLKEIIIKDVGADDRTIEKYMGKWTQIRILDPDDNKKTLERYERHVQVRGKSKEKPGLLFEIGFLKENHDPDYLRGLTKFDLNWDAVDPSWRPKEILEARINES